MAASPKISQPTVWFSASTILLLFALGIGLAGGCFTTPEISCENDADCFCDQICNNGVCESGENESEACNQGTGSGTDDGNGGMSKEEKCRDGKDNDGDGNTDCKDEDCQKASEKNKEENCADGKDNDCDGSVDCADSDCNMQNCVPKSVKAEEGAQCRDGKCVETRCWDCLNPPCVTKDGKSPKPIDNDGNGKANCKDPHCLGGGAICGKINENHTGATCAKVSGEKRCVENSCNNGQNDDGDQLDDESDPDCD